jgi:flagellar export protein FliJ
VKRFRWPLQRLLDVTERRELALRAELVALSRRIIGVRQEIVRRRAVLRTVLDELAEQPVQRRIAEQHLFMRAASVEERRIRALEVQLKDLESQRAAKTAEFLKTRSRRKTLDRLREEAYRRFLKEFRAAEQKQLDEVAVIAFARRRALAPAGRHG